MPQTAIVTGAAGFLGRHLVAELASSGVEVHGIGRKAPFQWAGHCFAEGDIRDLAFLRQLFVRVQPSEVYHLAGIYHGASDDPRDFYEINVGGTVTLLIALQQAGCRSRVLVASSSAVYGAAAPPVIETADFMPLSPYAGSKCAQEMVALQWHHDSAASIVRARLFNLLGPFQPIGQVASSLAHQYAQASLGRGSEVRAGNLASMRDFTDVRDAASACRLLCVQGQPGEAYNICTGRPLAIQAIADQLKALCDAQVTLVHDKARIRRNDLAEQFGSPRKLTAATGWSTKIGWQESVRDLYLYWQHKIASE